MFARLITLGLCLVTLVGCGVTPSLSRATTTPARATANDYAGSYLALCFEPSPEVAAKASELRGQLGFLDLTHAIPPRQNDEYHMTVGYFRQLQPYQAQKLAERFRNKNLYLYINGYGVVNQQVAYFTLQGTDEARADLAAMGLQFSADDPHVTFGVAPGNPRDVHGVPKKPQHSVGPYKLLAAFHLKQGSKNLW